MKRSEKLRPFTTPDSRAPSTCVTPPTHSLPSRRIVTNAWRRLVTRVKCTRRCSAFHFEIARAVGLRREADPTHTGMRAVSQRCCPGWKR